MAARVKVVRDNYPGFAKAVRALAQAQVLVGIPDSAPERAPDGSRQPLNNAQIGYLQDRGVPSKNIPPRPWLEPGVATIQDKAAKRLAAGADAALTGDFSAVDKTLNAVGLMAQAAVRAKLVSGPFVPLKASTLAARQRRGRTGTSPLIDTGQLLRSVTYVIRPK